MGYAAPSELFRQAVPDAFVDTVLRALIQQNRDAHKACASEHEPSEVHDLYPARRRAKFEQSLRDVAQLHGGEATAVPNAHGGAYHSEVRFRNVVLTASSVESPGQLPREAVFRSTLAESAQRNLFKGDDTATPGASLYAILAHGKPKDPRTGIPSFVSILFPDSANEKVLDSIDLTLRLHAATKVAAEENTERELPVKMKRKSKKRSA